MSLNQYFGSLIPVLKKMVCRLSCNFTHTFCNFWPALVGETRVTDSICGLD